MECEQRWYCATIKPGAVRISERHGMFTTLPADEDDATYVDFESHMSKIMERN